MLIYPFRPQNSVIFAQHPRHTVGKSRYAERIDLERRVRFAIDSERRVRFAIDAERRVRFAIDAERKRLRFALKQKGEEHCLPLTQLNSMAQGVVQLTV